MIQALHLFGYLPNMLEISMNPCVQGCEYCYAKTWKRENIPIEKVVNDILRQEEKKEGLLPFLIRKRSTITMSNRTDLMCAPDWRERLSAIKKLGFNVYIETKLNKDYKDLVQILDPKKDAIYQTITGKNNKYEEHNILSAEEKLEAGKWLNEQGFNHTLAINPYMPDKVSLDEIKEMIDFVKPHGVVMRDYHTTSKTIHRYLYREEYPKDIMKQGKKVIRDYCKSKNILHDIDDFEDSPYPELNLRDDMNERLFGGNSIIYQDFLVYVMSLFDDDTDVIDITLDDFLDFYSKQIDFFKGCVFKRSDYPMTNGKSNFRWEHDRFGIEEFLAGLFNQDKLFAIFDHYNDQRDDKGNMIYFRNKNGFSRDIQIVKQI